MKSHLLLVASDHGIYILTESSASWEKTNAVLRGHQFTALAQNGEVVLAGSTDGIYRSLDSGKSWQKANDGLGHRHIRALKFHPKRSDLVFAGTEPAAIYVSHDQGATWRECSEVSQLRAKYQWSLPYSSEAGCVRGFAFQDDRGYAAVEVGGMLRSDDSGENWQLMDKREDKTLADSPGIHTDVHSVYIHPSSADYVFAATGGGLYHSKSGGRNWTRIHSKYCRAMWTDPQSPEWVITGTADGPDRNGRIEETSNGGETWNMRMDGMNPIWPRYMVERFMQLKDRLYAVLSNGKLISSPLNSMRWYSIQNQLQGVRAISKLA